MKYNFFYNNVLYAGRGSVTGAYTATADDYVTAEKNFWEYMEIHSQWGDKISFKAYDENGDKVSWYNGYVLNKEIDGIPRQRPLHFVCYLSEQPAENKCEFKITIAYYDDYAHAQKQAEYKYKDYLIDNMKDKVKGFVAARGKYSFSEYLDYHVTAKVVLKPIEDDIAEVKYSH